MGRRKSLANINKLKDAPTPQPQDSPPPRHSPTKFVPREDPRPWLKGASLPANWKHFASRDIVPERQFFLDDIVTKSAHGNLQLPNAVDLFRDKHILNYINHPAPGYPSLTKLFYASLGVSSDGDTIFGFIGKFTFSITLSDVVAIFENDQEFLKEATDVRSEEFLKSVPSYRELIEMYFIVGTRKPHVLVRHVDYLYSLIINTNILPAKGNKSELTQRILDVIWIINHHKPCLAHLIFKNMKSVLGYRKNAILPYPSLIATLLESKGFIFPSTHERPISRENVTAKAWDRSLNAGFHTRLDAFESKGWEQTKGMVVGGEPLPKDHPDSQPRKRRATAPLDSATPHAVTYSNPSDAGVSSRLETSVAILSNLVTNLSVTVSQRFDDMNTRFTKLETRMDERSNLMEDWMESLEAKVDQIHQDVLGWKKDEDEPATVSDDDDDDDPPLFLRAELPGKHTSNAS